MKLDKKIQIHCEREEACALLRQDETLISLFPDTKTEIIESTENRKTTQTQYQALGRDGVATFHFDFLPDGNVNFSKVCDGNVWKKLEGKLSISKKDAGTEVGISLEGATKAFIPEFTIRSPMHEQIQQMATALQQRLEKRS